MENASDEVIKQILIQSNENQIKLLCSTNKRFSDLYRNQKFMEVIYNIKSQNTILQDIIDLKEPGMSWKELYTRVFDFKNTPLSPNKYWDTSNNHGHQYKSIIYKN